MSRQKPSSPPGRPPAGCTIIFRNYLSHARILMESFARHVPGGRFYLLVVDGLPPGVTLPAGVRLIQPDDLKLPAFGEMCFKYDVTELATAVKPSLLKLLLNRFREDRVAYFDPDILILRPLDEMWQMLETSRIVLTPHLLEPLPLDGLKPSEQDILLSGAYNLGFVAVRRGPETQKFLGWWEERLRDHCRIDHAKGLFTDQRWIDFVPGYFSSVAILRDPTYNVAYWNLHARQLTKRGHQYLVNGRPVAFFHFSGFSPLKPDILSKHQTRITIKRGSALAKMLDGYVDLQMQAGYATTSLWASDWNQFSNGHRLHSLLKKLYLDLDKKTQAHFRNPLDASGPDSFLNWAIRPPSSQSRMSPFLKTLYQARKDVATKFPKVPGPDEAEFLEWAVSRGALEMGYNPDWVARKKITSVKTIAAPKPPKQAVVIEMPYAQMTDQIRKAAQILPPRAKGIVISKGDPRLLQLKGRPAGHFPQAADGSYSGYYPKDDADAIAQLEALRAQGNQFLLIPKTAFWWLEHYTGFFLHLQKNYRVTLLRKNCCVIFGLNAPALKTRRPQLATQLNLKSHAPVSADSSPPPLSGPGINVAGYLASEKGVGEGVRSDIRALEAAKIPYVLNNFSDSGSANIDSSFTRFSKENPHRVNLIHVNADQVPHFVRHQSPSYFKDRYNIGFWAWELAQIPPEWLPSFQWLDEVWVPSQFNLDTISRVSPVPVVRMPHCIPARKPARRLDRAHFGLPKKQFIFLFLFDFHSFLERKNPLGLIRAFRRAFRRQDNAMLIIKGSHAEDCPAELAALQKAAEGANVQFFNAILKREEVTALMGLADCYVSLHRSEGFGLTLAEAMQLGKPVIGTAYSGNMDFMNSSNSFLVNHRMIEIQQDHGCYKKGYWWADPDLEHASQQMRRVYEDRPLARKIGQQAAEDIHTQFSPEAVGRLIQQRLERVSASAPRKAAHTAAPEQQPAETESPEKTQYRQLIRKIHDLSCTVLPQESRVIVISKGDDALIRLPGRCGQHFPQTAGGYYAGHYPADSATAIQHLEDLKAAGGQFLLVPVTALWWLKHYRDFRKHLEDKYSLVLDQPNLCLIYSLQPKMPPPALAEPKAASIAPTHPDITRPEKTGCLPAGLMPSPIIMFGAPRSGTTYVQHILEQHRELLVTNETRVFAWLHQSFQVLPHNQDFLMAYREEFLQHLESAYPALIRDFYLKIKPHARWWGDKNPLYADPINQGCLETIARLFPGAKFIHIVRDGRDVVTSMMRRRTPEGVAWYDFPSAHKTWNEHVTRSTAFGRTLPPENYFELRYEDLIADDVGMARKLFNFLEVPMIDKVLAFCRSQQEQRTPLSTPTRDLTDVFQSDWHRLLDVTKQRQSLELLGENLIAYGYETVKSLAAKIRKTTRPNRRNLPLAAQRRP